jgi:hypothetical protein
MRKYVVALFSALLAAVLLVPAGTANAAGEKITYRDAHKAARFEAATGATRAGVTPLASWYSGTVAAGATQGWVWNNANPLNAAYKVGLSPTGASTSTPCQFTVTRNWYVQLNTGERKFYFNIQNTGGIACAATILLSSLTSTTSWSSGGINAGASQNWVWNNANPLTASYLVGLSPTGSTSTATCQFEVTRTWYSQQPGGERRFNWTIKNVGTIACVATVYLASTTTSTSWGTGTLSVGATGGWTWNNANPLNLVYLPGLSPLGASGSTPCQLEVTGSSYQQVINASGAAERKFLLSVKNVGAIACSGNVLLAGITA